MLAHPATALALQTQDAQAETPPGVEAAIQQLLDDPRAALETAVQARDAQVAAWPMADTDALVRAVEHHAIVAMIAGLPPSGRGMLTDVWASHPGFVAAIARVYTPSNDGATVAIQALSIANQQGDSLESYAELAAAVCVVLDRPHEFPALGSVLPSAEGVFEALVYAHEDRRVTALPLDELPAELLVHLTDFALTGEGIREIIQDRRATDPHELYDDVPFVQPGLLSGEAAPGPEDFGFDRIVERGGAGPIRTFYAEQLGQSFGWPVSIATGRLAQERFQAPVFLESDRRGYAWSLEAIPDHPGVALGTTTHPVTGQAVPLSHLVLTADLARAGVEPTREAWALLRASQHAPDGVRQALLTAARSRTVGFIELWRDQLESQLQQAGAEADGVQRVLAEFLQQIDRISPLLGTELVLEQIGSMGEARGDLLEWMALTSRRDPHRVAAVGLAIGDAALARGDRAAAESAYEDVLNRHIDETPLALDALARLKSLLDQDGTDLDRIGLYARTHRRLRAPRASDEAMVRASAFMIVGEQYERLLRDAGREREAERLRRQLDRALP